MWGNQISQHIMTSIFTFFEVIFTIILPPSPLHLPFLLLILLFYLLLAYLTRAEQGFYVYLFLDPGVDGAHNGRVAGYTLGIFAASLVIFGVAWIAIWVRGRIVGTKVKWAKGVAVLNVRRGYDEELGEVGRPGAEMREQKDQIG